MKFISLFAGIGGLDLGLERAGMECVAQVEIDEFCQKVLAKHWPDVPKWKDVRDVGKRNLPKADAVVGGFPCQPFSTAGQRKGKEDDRYLWPEMLRVIKEIKPKWVIGENVAGIINMELDSVLASLEDEGYTCETFVLPASAVGAPHRRDRVFIVAHSNTNSIRRNDGRRTRTQPDKRELDALGRVERLDQDVSNSSGNRLEKRKAQTTTSLRPIERAGMDNRGKAGNWTTEPGMGRVADGVPDRVDRIRTLGAAIVPQLAEIIGCFIMQAEQERL